MVTIFLIYLSILCMETTGEPLFSNIIEDRLDALEDVLMLTKYDLSKAKDGIAKTELINQGMGNRLTATELKNRQLENRVTATELKNKQLENRVTTTELKNILLEDKNIELELKLSSFIKYDSKFLELEDRLGLTISEIIHTRDKPNATNEDMRKANKKLITTDAELINIKLKLKTTNAELVNTKANLISTNSNVTQTEKKPKTTDAELNTSSEFVTTATEQNGYPTSSGKTVMKVIDAHLTNTTKYFIRETKLNAGKSGNKIVKSKRVNELGSVVAFHAELGPRKSNLNPGQTIIFENVKQNFGNAYDSQFGVFTCPKSGLYFFTVTITSYTGKYIETKLVANGSPIAYCLSAGHPGSFEISGSKSVIVPLHPGDRVWLEFNAHDNNVYGGGWSTLTGFIIKEM